MFWCVLVMTLAAITPRSVDDHKTEAKSKEVTPQVRPVLVFNKAVKDGDQALVKAAFSERIRKELEEEGWPKALKACQDTFKEAFGDYRLEDFAFEFLGEESAGKVVVTYRRKNVGEMRVVEEKGLWKLDER